MALQAKYRFGEVEVRIEGDLLLLHAHGILTTEVAHEVLKLLDLMYKQHGQFFVLGDLQDGTGIPPNVRRLLAEETLASPPAAVAFYGGNLIARATNALMVGAIKMVGGPSRNIHYFATAEQAQEWIAAERKRLSAT